MRPFNFFFSNRAWMAGSDLSAVWNPFWRGEKSVIDVRYLAGILKQVDLMALTRTDCQVIREHSNDPLRFSPFFFFFPSCQQIVDYRGRPMGANQESHFKVSQASEATYHKRTTKWLPHRKHQRHVAYYPPVPNKRVSVGHLILLKLIVIKHDSPR